MKYGDDSESETTLMPRVIDVLNQTFEQYGKRLASTRNDNRYASQICLLLVFFVQG